VTEADEAEKADDDGVKTMRLVVSGQDNPVTLTFEFWADQYVLPADTTVLIEFDDIDPPIEVVHAADGITFFSSGRFPRLWTPDGEEIEI
jgi:hypothetical protein